MLSTRWIVAVGIAALAACGPQPSRQALTPAVEKPSAGQSADTAAVRAHYLAGIAAFNDHQLDAFMAQFAPEIEMYTPTGWLRGGAAVRERFASTFEQFPRVRMEIDSLRVRSTGADVAIVDFRWRVYPMGQGPAFHGVGSGVYVRRGTGWLEVLEHETVTRVDPELERAR